MRIKLTQAQAYLLLEVLLENNEILPLSDEFEERINKLLIHRPKLIERNLDDGYKVVHQIVEELEQRIFGN